MAPGSIITTTMTTGTGMDTTITPGKSNSIWVMGYGL
jgi:hypothetical protein